MNQDTRNWISGVIGAILAAGFSGADAFHFSRFGTGVDLLLFVAGLSVLGIHVITSNAAVAQTLPPATPPTMPPTVSKGA